jgi:hypothetical protein
MEQNAGQFAASVTSFDVGSTSGETAAFVKDDISDCADLAPGGSRTITAEFRSTSSRLGPTIWGQTTVFFNFAGFEGLDAGPNIVINVARAPEPSTCMLLLLGFFGIGYAGYRRAETTRRANCRADQTCSTATTPGAALSAPAIAAVTA